MSVSHGIISTFYSSSVSLNSRSFRFLSPIRYISFNSSLYHSIKPYDQNTRGGYTEQTWKMKPQANTKGIYTEATESISDRLSVMKVTENSGQSHASVPSIRFGSDGPTLHAPVHDHKFIWKPMSHGTVSGATTVEVGKIPVDQATVTNEGNGTKTASAEKSNTVLTKLMENFTVDNSTYSLVNIRATFYPKFENEKSDQEIRMRMIEMVSKGLATMEVSLKHSGSLFMYAGHEGGAYAKNSYGNMVAAQLAHYGSSGGFFRPIGDGKDGEEED